MRAVGKKVQSRVLIMWQLRTVLACLLPSALVSLFFEAGTPVWRMLTALWVFFALAVILIYYPIKYLRLSYSVVNDCLVITCGVIYSRVKAMPLESVQFVSQSATPMQLLFKLRTLVVYAPGGAVHIPGLSVQSCAELAAVLVERGEL